MNRLSPLWLLTLIFLVLAAWSGRAAAFSLSVGDLLLANYGGNNVIKIDGSTWEQQNLGTFAVPTDLALAPDGNLYISEWGGAIKRLNLNTGALTLVNPGTSLSQVWGITLGPTGDLFVTSRADHSVVRIDPATGVETLITQSNLLSGPIGIALLDADHVVVSCFLNSEIVSVALADGSQTAVVGGANGIDQPWGIAVHGTDMFVTAYDQKLIQRITGATVGTFYSAPGFPYGIDVHTDGTVAFGASSTTEEVLRISSDGVHLSTFSGGLIQQVTGIEISDLSLVADGLVNSAPLVDPISNVAVTLGGELTFVASAVDTDWPPQTLTYSLDPGAPAAAGITADGVFSWTPVSAPDSATITVRVTDNGDPVLSATQTFTVTVTQNTSPLLTPIPDQTVYGGSTLSFVAQATDADVPSQTLTHSLEPGSPSGATITPSGTFTWTAPVVASPMTNSATVTVVDNGTPSLSTSTSFSIVVSPAVAVEPGDILVANYSGDSVIRIDPATGDQQRLAPFNAPTDVAVAYGGDLVYVCEWNGTVKWLNLTSGVSGVANPDTQMVEAWAVVLGPNGGLHVASSGDDGIVTINPGNGLETVLSAGNLISGPFGVDLLDAGHLVVGSQYDNSLVSVALADGSQTLIVQDNGLDAPWGVATTGTDVLATGSNLGVVQRVTAGMPSAWHTPSGYPYGISVDSNGNVVIGVIGASQQVVLLNSAGTVLNTYTDGLIADPTGLEIYRVLTAPTPPPNTPPIIAAVADQIATPGTALSLTVGATDTDLPPQMLTFSLDPGFPDGATITPEGILGWTPSQSQAPSVNPITVRVTDDGSPAQSDTVTFSVTVQRSNRPPVPGSPILERSPTSGTKLAVAGFLGSDPDGDPVTLDSAGPTSVAGGAVSIVAGYVAYEPPPGLSVGDTFAFTVSDGQGGVADGTATVTIKDDTEPSQNVVVTDLLDGSFRLQFDGIPGLVYRIQYTDSLDPPNWQGLGSITADPFGSLQFTDTPPGGFARPFYRSVYP